MEASEQMEARWARAKSDRRPRIDSRYKIEVEMS
jgi:hypothetical protein